MKTTTTGKKSLSSHHKSAKITLEKTGRERAWGICDYVKKRIKIDPRQPPKDMLDTLIHESIHWLEPEWSERKVAATAAKLTSVIWALGYRQVRTGTKTRPITIKRQ